VLPVEVLRVMRLWPRKKLTETVSYCHGFANGKEYGYNLAMSEFEDWYYGELDEGTEECVDEEPVPVEALGEDLESVA
jgi:hypothetical protein